MRVNCDLCGGQPAAVLCCADEAALCTGCDRRIHGANKLASKHRRIPLVHPAGASSGDSTAAAPPICDVCKERRGLVFCVEDRAILCADCDDPIHSANDLTAKHSRFLLVGAKLSAAKEEVPASQSQDDVSFVAEGSDNNGGGGAMISDYLTNICPGWRFDELLLDDSAASFPAAPKARRDEPEHVPSMDADLFDVVAGRSRAGGLSFEDQVPTAMAVPTAPKLGRAREAYWNSDAFAGRSEKRGGAWAPPCTGGLSFEEAPIAMAAPTAAKAPKLGRARETYWSSDSDSDVFAVPEITPPPAKRARPSSSSFLWCS